MKQTKDRYMSAGTLRACARIVLLSALVLALPWPAQANAQAPGHGARDKNVARQVKRRLRAVARAKTGVDRIWDPVAEIVRLGESAAPHLAGALRDPNPRLRLAAAVALCRLDEPDDACEALLELAVENADENVRVTAMDALRLYGDDAIPEDIVEKLKPLLKKPAPTPRMEIALCQAVYELADEPQDALVDRVVRIARTAPARDARRTAALAALEMDKDAIARVVDQVEALAEEPTPSGATARLALVSYRSRRAGAPKGKPAPKKEPKRTFLEEVIFLAKKHYVTKERILNKKEKEEKGLDLAVQDRLALGMVKSLDPFSDYYNRASHKQRRDDISGTYGGIGAYVRKNADDRFVVITQPNYAGPAYKAGARSLDEIVGADGERFDDRDSLGRPKDLQYVIKRLKGRPGTDVDVLMMRRGWTHPRTIRIRRGQIRVPTVEYELLPGGVAYIRLTQFGSNSGPEMRRALRDLENDDMRGIILDLRGNPGGQLTAVQQIADLFLPRNTLISYMQGRWGRWARRVDLMSENRNFTQPMVCLIDGGSASGSEMLSATLKDHGRAVVLGETSFGKGSGQNSFLIPGYNGERWLKLTLFKFYSPRGRTNHGVGVSPHRVVKPPQWPLWKSYEFDRLVQARAYDDYMDMHMAGNEELFKQLANNDGRATSRYPGFDKWYAGLDTTLSTDDVRRFLRLQGLRRVEADNRGRKYVQNYQDDDVLQEAIIELFRKLGDKDLAELRAITEYKPFLAEKLHG